MRLRLLCLFIGVLSLAGCQTLGLMSDNSGHQEQEKTPAQPKTEPDIMPSTQQDMDDAKAQGMAFIGEGHQPSFVVKVKKHKNPAIKINLENNQKLEVKHSQLEQRSRQGMLIFRGSTKNRHQVKLTVTRGQCAQNTSNPQFKDAVDLAIGNQHYRGCGAFLF